MLALGKRDLQSTSSSSTSLAQSRAAKIPLDQKGSAASALESSRSLFFPASDAPQVCHISFLCKRVVAMGPFQICGCPFRQPRVFEIAHVDKFIDKYFNMR